MNVSEFIQGEATEIQRKSKANPAYFKRNPNNIRCTSGAWCTYGTIEQFLEGDSIRHTNGTTDRHNPHVLAGWIELIETAQLNWTELVWSKLKLVGGRSCRVKGGVGVGVRGRMGRGANMCFLHDRSWNNISRRFPIIWTTKIGLPPTHHNKDKSESIFFFSVFQWWRDTIKMMMPFFSVTVGRSRVPGVFEHGKHSIEALCQETCFLASPYFEKHVVSGVLYSGGKTFRGCFSTSVLQGLFFSLIFVMLESFRYFMACLLVIVHWCYLEIRLIVHLQSGNKSRWSFKMHGRRWDYRVSL